MPVSLQKFLPVLLLAIPLWAQYSPPSCEDQYRSVLESTQATPSEKRLAEFSYRICGDERYIQQMKKFQISDGIDQFEAWWLANDYRNEKFGICGMTRLPSREGNTWKVKFGYGANGISGPTIEVNAITGEAVCEGHPPLAVDMAARMNALQTMLKAVALSKTLTPEQREERRRAEMLTEQAQYRIEMEKIRLEARSND